MGGKPFQSKGCKNCKQRKVKCDTQRPGCGNCLKRGIECLGYDKKLVFVYDKSAAQNKRPRGLDRDRAGQITVRAPMALNSASASREQIVASYINLYFPDEISGSTEIDPWFKLISGIVAIPNKTVMLEKAMAATSCIYIGRMNKDNRLLNHGLQLYNGAIHHVSQQLSRSNPYTDELFFTIGIFQILVALYCPHGLDTMVHQTAVTNGIYTQCFYRASDTPIIKTLCVAFQRMRLLKALSPVESNSVLDVALEHTPAAMISHENQPVDELFHLMANIAPIAAAISLTDVSDNEACHQLLYDCLEHRGKLLSWYAENKDSIGGGPYVAKSGDFPSKSISPSEHLFGLPYGFSSLDNARIHVLFWAALSMIQALTGQTYAYAYTSAPVDVNNANKEFQLSEYYADEVSRAMPYCLQDSMKAWGISGTIFGMGQISKVYMELRREEKFMWSQQLFKHSGDIGSDLAYRMGELLQYGWVLLEKADRDQRPELSSLPSTSPGPNSPHSSSTASPASPASSISTTSTASTAPFVAEYAAMQPEVTELPSRIKWTPDN